MTKAALEKWVETQRIISKEKRDLKIAEEILIERIGLLQREISSVREKIDEAEKNIAEADRDRAKLIEENETLTAGTAALTQELGVLEEKTRLLLDRLPDPIREHVRPLSQRLPESPDETELPASQRFQNVVGILNEVNKFQRQISVFSEVRALPDGSSVEVTSVYLGISKAYYVNADGTIAGVGSATDDGWVWTPANESAQRISQAVSILKNEEVASFVQVPMKIN